MTGGTTRSASEGLPTRSGDERQALTDRYRARSLWLDILDDPLAPRSALEGDLTCDVAIVGAGFIGLWTAYSLIVADPTLDIVVLEAEIAGFGAASRNAGFVSAGIAGEAAVYEQRGGVDAVRRAERAMVDGVGVIGRVVADEDISCGWVHNGALRVALTRPQLERLHAGVERKRSRGLTEDDYRYISAAEVGERVRLPGVLGGTYTPHCARVNPAALARGLARAAEARGVRIFEQTRAFVIEPHVVRTERGVVRAPVVIRATEAFTVELPRQRRAFLPMYSHMLATEPLPDALWDEIGWAGCEPIADQRYAFNYGQRTVDGRIALGGAGATYLRGSKLSEAHEGSSTVLQHVELTLRKWFPSLRDIAVTHRWGGAFATPRDWSMGIGFDLATGMGYAGGLAGHGVVASSLCGRTLADLVLDRESDLTTLPWVGHESSSWEPEPFRGVAARLIPRVLASADRVEERTGRKARRMVLVRRFTPGR